MPVLPNDESEHAAVCPVCGQTYDRRKAEEVERHAAEHDSVEHPRSEVVGVRVGEIDADNREDH